MRTALSEPRPLASVLVPSFNYGHFLPQAVRSILKQTYRPLEIVIVEDGSRDGSLDIARRLEEACPGEVRVFTHPGGANRGIVETYRLALARASGELIAFLEADDLWAPDNLEKKVDVLQRHPAVGVVYSDYVPFGDRRGSLFWNVFRAANRLSMRPHRPADLFATLLARNPVASFSHFMVRRRLLETVPPLTSMRRNYDWWVLAHAAHEALFYYIPEPLCFWRIHPGSAWSGRVGLLSVCKLHFFILDLCESLAARRAGVAHERHARSIARAAKRSRPFRALLRERKRLRFALGALVRPDKLARFLAYLALRNWLLARGRREPALAGLPKEPSFAPR